MINKEVITKTQKRLIRINMLVVSGFLILLCMFTYVYFGYTNNNNINKQMENELNSIISQLENLDSRYGLILGLKAEGIKLQNPKDMVYMYIDNTLIKVNTNPYFGDNEPKFKNQGDGFIHIQQKKDIN